MHMGKLTVDGAPSPGRRRWGVFLVRVAGLWLRQPARTAELVCRSYDRIAGGYDQAWTTHMRDLSLAMIDRLKLDQVRSVPVRASRAIDLTCGTGFLTAELARRLGPGTEVLGVDASAGMLAEARRRHGPGGEGKGPCRFVQADAVDFLRSQPARSADVITCGWGLGYTRPLTAVRQIARVLRPGGQVGIIDNSLLSLAEVMWCSVLAFAERPAALRHVMKVRFLPASAVLAAMMRACGLGVRWRVDGAKTYRVGDGRAAIARLTATGAAAGFEFAADGDAREAVFERFAQIMDERYGGAAGVPVTHRYLAVVGVKGPSRSPISHFQFPID